MPDEELLRGLARRITGGDEAGSLLRHAWREASNGFDYMPFIRGYFFGPQYLGPAHPVVLDAAEEIPEVYTGYILCNIENSLEIMMNNPSHSYDLSTDKHVDCPGEKGIVVLETYYRVVQSHLERAAEAVKEARGLVPSELATVFEAETLPILWFYHTLRTCGNLYELNRIVMELKGERDKGEGEIRRRIERLREILLDEKQNTLESLPIAQRDTRMEVQRGDFSLYTLVDMMRAKLELLDVQIEVRLPELEKNYK